MSLELDNMREHLKSLEVFLASRAHVGYVAAREAEVKNLEDAIVAVEPVDRASEIEGFKLRGELRNQISMIQNFEDAREELIKLISIKSEQELQIATESKV